jgi:hypothetical protein
VSASDDSPSNEPAESAERHIPALTLLRQREIEAGIAGPLILGFIAEFGRERTVRVVREVVSELAKEAGANFAEAAADKSLNTFAGCLEIWKAGGALEIELLEQNETQLDFNVTRCQFAEMYRSLGLADLGASLSCQRDFTLIEGFNPEITLERTQTIMEGACHCDFRFRAEVKRAKQPTVKSDDPACRS